MWPRTGDIALSVGTAPTSIVTRVGTFSMYSHGEIVHIPGSWQRGPVSKWEVISAEASGGTQRMSMNKYRKSEAHIYRVDVDDHAAYRAYARAAKLARKKTPYNFLGLGWTAVVFWARLSAILRLNPGLLLAHEVAKRLPVPRVPGSFFCSMECQDVYKPERVRFVNHNGIVTPEDIARSARTTRIGIIKNGLYVED